MLSPYRERVPASGPATERPPAAVDPRPDPDTDPSVRTPPKRAPWVGAEPLRGWVVLGAAVALGAAAGLEIALRGHLGLLTGCVLVLVSVGAALVVRSSDLFTAGVLPPLLALGLVLGVSLLEPSAVSVSQLEPGAGAVQVMIAGFVDVAGALVVAHLLALCVVGLRARTSRRAARR